MSILYFLLLSLSRTLNFLQHDHFIRECIVSQRRGGCGLGEELEAASAVAADVTTTIMTQRMEIDSKNKSDLYSYYYLT